MTSALPASTAHRAKVYARLQRRNGLVTVLRILVPLIGVVALSIAALQVYVMSMGRGLEFGQVLLDRDRILVETPRYAGVMADGTSYLLTAKSASAPVNQLDKIDLIAANFLLIRRDGGKTTILADTARVDTYRQSVTVDTTATVDTSDGINGTLEGLFIDWRTQDITASGAVHLNYPNGTSVDAIGMQYDPRTETWTFTQSTVRMTSTPGEAL